MNMPFRIDWVIAEALFSSLGWLGASAFVAVTAFWCHMYALVGLRLARQRPTAAQLPADGDIQLCAGFVVPNMEQEFVLTRDLAGLMTAYSAYTLVGLAGTAVGLVGALAKLPQRLRGQSATDLGLADLADLVLSDAGLAVGSTAVATCVCLPTLLLSWRRIAESRGLVRAVQRAERQRPRAPATTPATAPVAAAAQAQQAAAEVPQAAAEVPQAAAQAQQAAAQAQQAAGAPAESDRGEEQ